MWFIFALLSAVFAALTSILAKIGIECCDHSGNIDHGSVMQKKKAVDRK